MENAIRFNLITRNTEEVLTEEDLEALLEQEVPLKHYIGFEISGKIHLGTGLMSMQKIKDFMDAGIECSVFLADWHSWINEKLGGDLTAIREVAVNYFKEGMKAAFLCVGGDPNKLNFVLGTELYHHNDDYWATVVEVSKHTTLSRMLRSVDILGREAKESIDFAKLIYPAMQVADIFIQGVSLAHAGSDQRKAHVIMRDVADKLTIRPLRDKKGNSVKPVAVHHHLLLGLQKPAVWPLDSGRGKPASKEELRQIWTKAKMSKSVPGSAVFIHDSPEEIREKIKAAFCPPKEIIFNPILDWAKHLLFAVEGFVLHIERPEKFGGAATYEHFEDLERDYGAGNLHPEDLKSAFAEALIGKLAPAREHFTKPQNRAMLEKLERVLSKTKKNE